MTTATTLTETKAVKLASIEAHIAWLNSRPYEPSAADILATIQMLVDALKEGNTPLTALDGSTSVSGTL